MAFAKLMRCKTINQKGGIKEKKQKLHRKHNYTWEGKSFDSQTQAKMSLHKSSYKEKSLEWWYNKKKNKAQSSEHRYHELMSNL